MRKMMRPAAGLAVFLMAAGAFCQGIPEYLSVSGTRITGCDKDRLPANLVIPEGITEIGPSVFRDCTSLASVTIPASVRTIGHGAFRDCTSLESVTIPAGVTKIGTSAFGNCTSLKSVTIPASVKTIGDFAFLGCKNIKTVQYRGTLAQWCQMDNTYYNENTTITLSDVPDLRALKTLVIPDGVTSIGSSAFNRCKELTSVTIPETVTEIGAQAFDGCSLESVTIPSSVRSMWGDAFSCRNLKTVKYNGTKAQWRKISIDGTTADTLAFWDGVTVHCTDGNILVNQDSNIVGEWVCVVPHEVPEGFDYHGTILYGYDEEIYYTFLADGSYSYDNMTHISRAIYSYGTYSVNAKQGKIKLTANNSMDSWYTDGVTLEIKWDALVDGEGHVFTKE